jgi:hypothetical protein
MSINFAAVLLAGIPSAGQKVQSISSIFDNLRPEQINAINESRRLAREDFSQQSKAFETPNIASALDSRCYSIAIAKVIGVRLPDGASTPKTIVRFHVEQLIQGDGAIADFDVESEWTPKPPALADGPFIASNYHPTALDLSEPKVGNRYVLGFTLAYRNDKFVFVPGVIDLQDPSQTELINSMERFLKIESTADRSGFEPYLAALDDESPWIRDIAVYRLTWSEKCNASQICAKTFLEVVKRQLGSETPNDRQQAVGWLIWIDSVSRNESQTKTLFDGLPLLPDSKIRALYNEAIDDRNVCIGDLAYQYREEFDFYRSKSPGDYFAIVPSLRKSTHWRSGGANPVPALFPLNYTYGCISPKDSMHS